MKMKTKTKEEMIRKEKMIQNEKMIHSGQLQDMETKKRQEDENEGGNNPERKMK